VSDNLNQAVLDKGTVKSQPEKAHRTKKPHPMPVILRLFRLGFRLGGALSPRLAGKFGYRLWFTPTRHKTPASEQAALKSATVEHHKINQQTIACYHWGDAGPTVLLVHGWSGRGTQLGAFAEPLVNAGYRVLSFDGPAHGQSTGKQTNLYEFADAILALQKHYGEFESVITHSFGGPCLAVAMQRGLTTKRVVSISPPADAEGLVKKFTATLTIPAKAEQDMLRRIETDFGADIWQKISMKHTVRELEIPALVIHDAHDADIPWQEGELIARAWNNAHFIKTSKLGHRRILRDPATIETAVKFIKTGSVEG
jgi:pimeloyl-ACP methyl ester carboxylesterase